METHQRICCTARYPRLPPVQQALFYYAVHFCGAKGDDDGVPVAAAAAADTAEPAGESMPHAGAEFETPAADAADADAAAVECFEGSLSAEEEEPALAADDAGVEERDASADVGAPDEAAAPDARIAAPVGFERALAAAAPAFFLVLALTAKRRKEKGDNEMRRVRHVSTMCK